MPEISSSVGSLDTAFSDFFDILEGMVFFKLPKPSKNFNSRLILLIAHLVIAAIAVCIHMVYYMSGIELMLTGNNFGYYFPQQIVVVLLLCFLSAIIIGLSETLKNCFNLNGSEVLTAAFIGVVFVFTTLMFLSYAAFSFFLGVSVSVLQRVLTAIKERRRLTEDLYIGYFEGIFFIIWLYVSFYISKVLRHLKVNAGHLKENQWMAYTDYLVVFMACSVLCFLSVELVNAATLTLEQCFLLLQ